MFGIFAKGKAARVGLEIRNLFRRSTDEQRVKIVPTLKQLDHYVNNAGPRRLRVKTVPHRNDKRMPIGTRMFRCGQGYFMRKTGYTAWSGPCPTPAAAQRTALKNMAKS